MILSLRHVSLLQGIIPQSRRIPPGLTWRQFASLRYMVRESAKLQKWGCSRTKILNKTVVLKVTRKNVNKCP